MKTFSITTFILFIIIGTSVAQDWVGEYVYMDDGESLTIYTFKVEPIDKSSDRYKATLEILADENCTLICSCYQAGNKFVVEYRSKYDGIFPQWEEFDDYLSEYVGSFPVLFELTSKNDMFTTEWIDIEVDASTKKLQNKETFIKF